MNFIGVDIGSTSIKAGVLDLAAGAVRDVRSRPFPNQLPGLPPAWFEVDADAVVRTTGELLAEVATAAADCRGVVACSQMGGLVLADDAGQSVSRYFSWRDQRTLEPHPTTGRVFVDELTHRATADDLERLGREIKPGSAAALLFWLSERKALPPAASAAVGLGEYVLARLCHAAPRSEPTSALGVLDLAQRDWHHPWFTRLGFGHVRWPTLCRADECIGEITLDGRSVPCYPAIGDQQAALLGAGVEEGELSINISTGSQVALVTRKFLPGDYQTRPYFDGRFLNTVTHLPAGRSLEALVNLLCELPRSEGYELREPWTAVTRAIERTPASGLDVSLAFFASAVGDRGYIRDIRLEELNVGSLFRAAFRHMADNYLAAAHRLSPTSDWRRLVLSGSLAKRLPALVAMISERFARPYRTVDAPEETLAGLLRLAEQIMRGKSGA